MDHPAGGSSPPAASRALRHQPARRARRRGRGGRLARRRSRAGRLRPRVRRRRHPRPRRPTTRWWRTPTSTSSTSPARTPLHLEHARLAFAAGKPVLCEKPLTLNRRRRPRRCSAGRRARPVLMEAMWMACHPLVRDVRERLAAGRFGDAAPGARRPRLRGRPARRPTGCSTPPSAREPCSTWASTRSPSPGPDARDASPTWPRPPPRPTAGIDLDVAIAARHDGGAVAALTTSMTSVSPRTATIATDARPPRPPADFHHPPYVVWTPTRRRAASGSRAPTPRARHRPRQRGGRTCSAACATGLTESPLVPRDQTLELLGVMDDDPRPDRRALRAGEEVRPTPGVKAHARRRLGSRRVPDRARPTSSSWPTGCPSTGSPTPTASAELAALARRPGHRARAGACAPTTAPGSAGRAAPTTGLEPFERRRDDARSRCR